MTASVSATVRQSPAPGRGRLLRVLGIGFGISIGVGAAIGGGILRVPAFVASELPHPGWIALVWLLVTGFVFIDANTHSELSAMIPKAGDRTFS